MTRRDRWGEQRAENGFMDKLMEGHADAARAMAALKMVLHERRTGGCNRYEIDGRLQRMSRLLLAASARIEAARERLP